MTDRDPFWDALKEYKKEKFNADRQRALDKAQADDDGGWTKHTEYHWSRMLNGKRLDYWPSRKKFMLTGWKQAKRGDVMKLVREQQTRDA